MTIEEMKKRISEDSETKDLKLTTSDIFEVNRYLNLRGKDLDGYYVKLVTDPYIEIVYLPSQTILEKKKQDALKKHLKVFDSEIYLQEASLDKFDAFNNERKHALKELNNFVNNYKTEVYEKGYYIYGKYGTGKTYLLSAVAHQLVKQDVDVLIVFMPDLVRSVRQGISDGSLEEKINQLKQVEVLMFDDIGGENMTAWFRDEVFLPILQYRLSASLTTFFSSNLTMKELVDNFSNNRSNELDYVKAVRVIKRITNLAKYLKLDEEQFTNN